MHCTSPEELFYQTVFLNSPFNSTSRKLPPFYLNFTPEGKPFIGHPYNFHKQDISILKSLKEKNIIYARKFDLSEDSNIFDLCDSINGIYKSN